VGDPLGLDGAGVHKLDQVDLVYEKFMKTVNIHEAKTHLSRLVEAAAKGEPFIIAKARKPLVKVIAVDAPAAPRRLGFMRGAVTVPDDFDTMGQEEIEKLFYDGK
jgi:prevent-host-death family protein